MSRPYLAGLVAAVWLVGCAGDIEGSGPGMAGPGEGGGVRLPDGGFGNAMVDGSQTAGPTDGALQPATDGGGLPDVTLDTDSACAVQVSKANAPRERPVDIIVLADGSSSMKEEIDAIRQNLNVNFAQIIGDSGVDYRIIFMAMWGPPEDQLAWFPICIGPPLSPTDCDKDDKPTNGERFFFYDQFVFGPDSWCQIVETFNRPDEHGLAPNGWQQWLREGSIKTFLILSDDRANCSPEVWTYRLEAEKDDFGNWVNPVGSPAEELEAAMLFTKFHEQLEMVAGDTFGTALKPNYTWHSIIGIADNDPADAAYGPGDPLVKEACDTADDLGTTYQIQSIVTGGLRYPVCEGKGFDVVFRALADNVIEGTEVDCRFDVPTPPDGAAIDLDSVLITYTPGDGGKLQKLRRADKGACDDESFFVDTEARKLELCGDTCNRVKQDEGATLEVVFGCKLDCEPRGDSCAADGDCCGHELGTSCADGTCGCATGLAPDELGCVPEGGCVAPGNGCQEDADCCHPSLGLRCVDGACGLVGPD